MARENGELKGATLNLRITESLRADFKQAAAARNLPAAELVRRLMREEINRVAEEVQA